MIQWKYSRGTSLPEQVPEEFRLVHVPGQATDDGAARIAYWSKLREEWFRPENWHTTYALDFGWPVRNAESISREVLRFIHQT